MHISYAMHWTRCFTTKNVHGCKMKWQMKRNEMNEPRAFVCWSIANFSRITLDTHTHTLRRVERMYSSARMARCCVPFNSNAARYENRAQKVNFRILAWKYDKVNELAMSYLKKKNLNEFIRMCLDSGQHMLLYDVDQHMKIEMRKQKSAQ